MFGGLPPHPYPCGQPKPMGRFGLRNMGRSPKTIELNALYTPTVKQPKSGGWRVQFDPLGGGLMSAIQKLT